MEFEQGFQPSIARRSCGIVMTEIWHDLKIDLYRSTQRAKFAAAASMALRSP